MDYQKASIVILWYCIASAAITSQDYRFNLVADVLLYEKLHSAPAFTTVLQLCREGKHTLLSTLSDAGISTLITDGERTTNVLQRISRMDPGDLMVAGVQDLKGRGFPESFLLDMDCERSNETLEMDINTSECDVSTLLHLPIRADSHVTVACRSKHDNSRWSFQHFYRTGSGAPVVSQERGEWVNRKMTINRHSDMMIRRDLMGYPVGAAFVVTDKNSLSHLTDGVDRHIDVLAKAPFLNVYTVLELLNSTPFVRFPDTWGYIRKNGTWQNGMVGMLHQGVVDIGGTGSMPLATRYDALQYIIFTTPIYGIFLFRAPPISYEYNLFGLPFAKSVWASSAIVLTLCCALLFPVMRYERRKSEEQLKKTERATLADVLLVGFAAICQQGATTHARGITSRIITLWLHLCVICLYASYTASIVVLLQTSGTSIHSLRDLWKSNIALGAEDAPYNTFFFTNSTDEVRRGIYQDKMVGKSPTNNFFTLEEGVHLMRTKFFAFHTITNNLYYMIGSTWREDEKCGLIEFDSYLPSNQVALSIRKNSPYMEMLRVKFALIYESGHRDWLLRRWVYPKPKCPPNMVRFSSASVVDVLVAIQIYGIGVILSVVALVAEIIIQRYSKSHIGYKVSHR